MIKVVVADDEENVCRLICNLVDWASFDMQIVGTANNGFEALEQVERLSPDLMVTDIRMPGCDGLELISRAKQLDSRLEFIIVSGYRHFEYAQNAIKYGVGDYLLKPIKKAELEATLEKMRAHYLHRTEQLSREQQLQLRLQSDIDKLRAGLFTDLLLRANARPEDLERVHINASYHYAFAPGCFQVVAVKVDGGPEMLTSGAFGVLEEKLTQILRGQLTGACTELEFCFQGARAWGVLGYEETAAPEVRRRLKAALDEFKVQKSLFPVQFTIGLGRTVDDMALLPLSAQDAGAALEQRLLLGTERLLTAPEQATGFARAGEALGEARRGMEAALEVLDANAACAALRALREEALACGAITGAEVLRLAGDAAGAFLMLARGMGYEPTDTVDFVGAFLARADLCAGAAQVFDELESLVGESVRRIVEQRRQEDTRPIRTAKQYIQLHFAEPLTLEEVGGAVGFNASYFSSLFKKETGQNFVEYLSEVRMNRAKELLRESDLTIAQICEAVGYADLKYFTKSFKKVTGIKPGEFRKLYS